MTSTVGASSDIDNFCMHVPFRPLSELMGIHSILPYLLNVTLNKSEEHSTEDQAIDILENGSPISYLMDQFTEIHIGDEGIGELLIATIGCQLCLNTEGLHPDLSGESGKGKSDACKAIGHLVPEEYFITGSLSDKVLFHMKIEEGSVIFMDDVEAFTPDKEHLIKTVVSQYQTPYKHRYTDLRQKGSKYGDVTLPARLTWWMTSKDSSFDIQVLNRFLKVEVNVGKEQDLEVMYKQIERATTGQHGFIVSQETLICRQMIRHLKQTSPVYVDIPYAPLIEWKNPDNRRNLSMFFDFIRSFAALNQYQRTRAADGHVIANLDDFDRAARLWGMIETAQVTGLTGNEQKVLQAINDSGQVGITQKDLPIACDMDKGSVSRSLHGYNNRGQWKGGLLSKVKGLYFDEIARVYRHSGTQYESSGLVPLKDREEAMRLINSCN